MRISFEGKHQLYVSLLQMYNLNGGHAATYSRVGGFDALAAILGKTSCFRIMKPQKYHLIRCNICAGWRRVNNMEMSHIDRNAQHFAVIPD